MPCQIETLRDFTLPNFWYFGLKFFLDRVKPNSVKNFIHALQLTPYCIKPITRNLVQCRNSTGLLITHPRKEFEWRPEFKEAQHYHRFREASKGDVIVDVGAYVGAVTIRDAKKVGNRGLVVSIEPLPTNYQILKENIRLNGLENVIPLNLALANYNGTAQFNITENPEGSFLASLNTNDQLRICRVIDVPVKRLDDIAKELRVDKFDFIKIDAEGSELEILKGATKLLQGNDVHLAIACYHTAQEVENVSTHLIANGFKVFVDKESIVYANPRS